MMKKILSLLLAAGMCLSMASCASADGASSAADSQKEDSNTSTQETTGSDVE